VWSIVLFLIIEMIVLWRILRIKYNSYEPKNWVNIPSYSNLEFIQDVQDEIAKTSIKVNEIKWTD
jgi:hypothetical protein